ncbi:hypothetical protein [Pantoea sp.]|nr:hypothetical protein [Pantoea sp.]
MAEKMASFALRLMRVLALLQAILSPEIESKALKWFRGRGRAIVTI